MKGPQSKPIEVTPEVLPPQSGGYGDPSPPHTQAGDPGPSRTHLALIGLVLDLLDLITWGPIGTRLGLPIGFAAAFALLTLAGMPLKRRLLLSAGAGLYCLLPGTERIPLGTLLGTFLRLR